MYPFFIRSASTSFLITLTTLCGCSVGSSNPVVSLPIDVPEVRQSAKCAKKDSSKANIYQCESEIGPLFVTTVKECSIPDKFTFQATTRQLLVGVMDLSVISQEPATFNSLKSLHSIVHGTMDIDPFLMSIYTFHQNDCVTDLVLWKGSSREKPSPEDTATFSNISSNLAGQLVSTLVSDKEQGRAGS